MPAAGRSPGHVICDVSCVVAVVCESDVRMYELTVKYVYVCIYYCRVYYVFVYILYTYVYIIVVCAVYLYIYIYIYLCVCVKKRFPNLRFL